MRLYLTRHGQTVWNIERRLQGWKDSELSEKGISNAKALRKRIKDINFYEVYASPVGRTMTTARIVSGLEEDKIIQDENLREINLGSWEGRLVDEIEIEYPEEYSAFRCSPHLYKRSDAESYYDVQKRALISVNNIIKKHGNMDRNILFVTHTVTLKTIMAYFENREFDRLWDPPFIYDTSLSMVEIKDGTGTIVMHGDISHFSDLKGYEFVTESQLNKKGQ